MFKDPGAVGTLAVVSLRLDDESKLLSSDVVSIAHISSWLEFIDGKFYNKTYIFSRGNSETCRRYESNKTKKTSIKILYSKVLRINANQFLTSSGK